MISFSELWLFGETGKLIKYYYGLFDPIGATNIFEEEKLILLWAALALDTFKSDCALS